MASGSQVASSSGGSETPKTIRLDLTYLSGEEKEEYWDLDFWPAEEVVVPLNSSISEVERTVKSTVTKNLWEESTIGIFLEKNNLRLSFRMEALLYLFGKRSFKLRQIDYQVEALADLFECPEDPPPVLFLNVFLQFWSRTGEEDCLIEDHKIRPGLIDLDQVKKWSMFRIGNIVDTQFGSTTAPNGNHKHKNNKAIWLGILLVVYPLGDSTQFSDFHLVSVPAWDFGDQCIGDCINDMQPRQHHKNDWYLPQYRGAETLKDIHDKVQENNRLGTAVETLSGVPFVPSYTWNHFSPEDYRLGVPYEQPGEVTGRFVNHLTFDATVLAGIQLVFPAFVRRRFEHAETIQHVTSRLVDDIWRPPVIDVSASGAERYAPAPAGVINTHVLFVELLKGTWDIQIWILPHGLSKMFKMEEHHHLSDFLSLSKARKGLDDRRLYMEAHIVSKGGTEMLELGV